ncbi:MAG TPA: hypothetical protein VE011_07155 [Candidatus Dormibacteraeota bacterium]|nr:hypothetical protein [Candidatus Dormibacteraeota bacterium]
MSTSARLALSFAGRRIVLGVRLGTGGAGIAASRLTALQLVEEIVEDVRHGLSLGGDRMHRRPPVGLELDDVRQAGTVIG